MPFNWTCPYCGRPQTVTDPNVSTVKGVFYTEISSSGDLGVRARSIVCSNLECRKPSVSCSIVRVQKHPNGQKYVPDAGSELRTYSLLPESTAKPQPDCIPKPLRDDYREACRIRDLSPKASATLSRRCLQGMIRDFCGISKPKLIDEIKELKSQLESGRAPEGVSQGSVSAIDAVRQIGNIGAHMERDINLIIDVDKGEAQLLIELIETLFEDWYVARHTRTERFSKIVSAAASKEEQKLIGKDTVPKLEPPQEA